MSIKSMLMKLGEKKAAQKIINKLLTTKPNSTLVSSAWAGISLMNNEVPTAIRHFELVRKIVRGNSERELVITNLCISVSD